MNELIATTNKIVKYDNKFFELSLRGLKATQLNILMMILSEVKGIHDKTLTLNLSDIRNRSGYRSKDNKRLAEDINEIQKKLMFGKEVDGISKSGIAIFSKYEFDKNWKTLKVKVNTDFIYLFNDVTNNFTKYELNEFVKIKTLHAKLLYMQLKRFKMTGYCTLTRSYFSSWMDIPEKYRQGNIDQKIINPALTELEHIFKGLHIEKVYGKSNGKRCIERYNFYFMPEDCKSLDEDKYLPIDNIQKEDDEFDYENWESYGYDPVPFFKDFDESLLPF